MKRADTLLLVFFFVLALSLQAEAQDNYEIQVYNSELIPKSHTMFELHSNFTINGSTTMQDGVYPSNHVIHETLEITHGFSKWLEVGSYLFTSIGSDNRTALTGVHLRPRLSVPSDYHLPLGLSLGAEIGYQNPDFFGSKWALEIRPIFDKEAGKFYFALNLPVGRNLDQGQVNEWEFSPSFKTNVDVSKKVSLGFEYYMGLGTIGNFDPASQQRHQLFGAIDWDFNPDWEFNAGIGYGLTPATDKWIVKFILGYMLPF